MVGAAQQEPTMPWMERRLRRRPCHGWSGAGGADHAMVGAVTRRCPSRLASSRDGRRMNLPE